MMASDHTDSTDGAYRHGAMQTPGARLHAVDMRSITKIALGDVGKRGGGSRQANRGERQRADANERGRSERGSGHRGVDDSCICMRLRDRDP
jgi:hypothetical protein